MEKALKYTLNVKSNLQYKSNNIIYFFFTSSRNYGNVKTWEFLIPRAVIQWLFFLRQMSHEKKHKINQSLQMVSLTLS